MRTRAHWDLIVGKKHPVLAGCEAEVERLLAEPYEVRRSHKDREVFLFYKGAKPRWLCAVVRRQDDSGFLITAYPTDAIKAGEPVWIRSG